MKLEELHSCPQSEGKIVMIEMDNVGNTYCGYCHQRVDYNKFFEEELLKKLGVDELIVSLQTLVKLPPQFRKARIVENQILNKLTKIRKFEEVESNESPTD
jgi:hypothetical protein